jgi:hypothetical protein
LDRARNCVVPELRRFATGLRADLDAVRAVFSSPSGRLTAGIEVQCAQQHSARRRGRRFPAGPHLGSHPIHVLASPPTIPEGGISPFRF